MNTTITRPSFNTCYYVRKLLLQYENELQAVVKPKVGFCLNSKTTLEELLYSVYLEEALENNFLVLYKEEKIIETKIQQLEDAVTRHQNAVNKNPSVYEELVKLKRKIFCILGFKTFVVKIEEVVNALNQLSQFSKEYLGNSITTNHWQSTRPDFEWLKHFQIERSAKFTYLSQPPEFVTFEQLQSVREWTTVFVKRSSVIIRDFSTIIEQQKIGELSAGVLLTSVNSYSDWLKPDP